MKKLIPVAALAAISIAACGSTTGPTTHHVHQLPAPVATASQTTPAKTKIVTAKPAACYGLTADRSQTEQALSQTDVGGAATGWANIGRDFTQLNEPRAAKLSKLIASVMPAEGTMTNSQQHTVGHAIDIVRDIGTVDCGSL
jgi:hypothetical protein